MSGSSRATPRRRRRARGPVRVLLVLGLLLLAAAGVTYAVVRGSGSIDASSSASASPTPLSDLDVSDRRIPRGPFCAALKQDDIEAALGGPVTRTEHYDSGDRVTLAPGLTDVAHEYNCGYAAATGATARAWVFAAPVSRTAASGLVGEPTEGTGCRQVVDGPGFGRPSATSACQDAAGRATVVTLRGLFASSWLSCQLTAPGTAGAADPVRRAERWCVQVATSMGTRR